VAAEFNDTNYTDEDLVAGITRLNGTILAVVLGLMSGLIVFVATIWLVIKGGERVGPHLSLLGQFFPGYSVSFAGSFAGFVWGAVVGGIAGWTIGWLYNRLAFRVR
jgi:hypothetical protein